MGRGGIENFSYGDGQRVKVILLSSCNKMRKWAITMNPMYPAVVKGIMAYSVLKKTEEVIRKI